MVAKRGRGERSIYTRKDGHWTAKISVEGGKSKFLYGKTRVVEPAATGEKHRQGSKHVFGNQAGNKRMVLGNLCERAMIEVGATITHVGTRGHTIQKQERGHGRPHMTYVRSTDGHAIGNSFLIQTPIAQGNRSVRLLNAIDKQPFPVGGAASHSKCGSRYSRIACSAQ